MATIVLDAGTTIQGESVLKTDKIDALAVNHSVELPIAVDKSSGRTRGRSQHGEIELIKAIDKSSANLYFACSKGQNLGDVTISLFKNQEDGPAVILQTVITSLSEVSSTSHISPSRHGMSTEAL